MKNNLPPLEPMSVAPDNVWLYAQNKPSLVAADLQRLAGVDPDVTYSVLLARGVFKWLAVRRDLIRLKNYWRQEIVRCHADQRRLKLAGQHREAREVSARIKALVECRQAVRALCHSERWRCPDFDGKAWKWLNSKGEWYGDGVPDQVRRKIRRGIDGAEPKEAA